MRSISSTIALALALGLPGTNALGEPPISTWDYGNFVVYFENQHVIHSVVPHNR